MGSKHHDESNGAKIINHQGLAPSPNAYKNTQMFLEEALDPMFGIKTNSGTHDQDLH